ncbi:MAG: TauD/TfdA family dioxygenase [Chloroflexota bacterium]
MFIPTPDFETYSMQIPVVAAEMNDECVTVTWSDGQTGRFHHLWLRDNDASPSSIDDTSRERAFTLNDVPLDIKAKSVSVGANGSLQVEWPDGLQSQFHPGWLRHFDYSNQSRPVETWEVKTWGQALESNLPIFTADAVFHDEDTRYDFLVTIRRLGLAIVTDMPKDFDAFERISSQIGLLRDMNWGKIFEIEPRPDGEYLANRGLALDAHSDASTREHMPGFQIFQCVENTSQGGESFWVDGFYVAELMRRDYPEYFELLSTVPWEFASRSKGTHYRWNAPVFDLDRHGQISAFRDTTWLREPLRVEYDLVPKLFAAYKQMVALKSERANQVERKLVEGDVAFVDNRRVLHGRRAFEPGTGHRHIRTCYGEREELLSSIRMIERGRARRVNLQVT